MKALIPLTGAFMIGCSGGGTVPASVDSVSVSSSSSSATTATVQWTPPTSTVGVDDPTGYRVYRSTDDKVYERIADVGADIQSWLDYDARSPVSFYFVTAYNETGESDPSEIVSKNF